jgi:uncharacterized protein involved in outer membrane biogenesis
MSRKRFFGVFFGIVGAVLLAVVLYVAFGDLGRHKSRIEAFVSKSIGRPFSIEGPLKLTLVPVLELSAERVRLGNMPGGSEPQMVEVGKVAVKVGFWSLISGPPDVHSIELHDTTVLLEQGPDGKGNWIMGPPEGEDPAEAEDEADEEDETAEAEVPLVIRSAQLHNVRIVYREAKKADRVLQLDDLGITPGREQLLALDGQGKVDVYPLVLKGEAGPLKSLLSATDMRAHLQVTLGKLAMDINGVVGKLEPLDGADLTLKIEHPELGSMLRKLEFPIVAEGSMQIEGRMKDAGALTELDFNATVGDLKASLKGTLKELSLVGGDLTLTAEKQEIGPLLEALKLPVIATGPMRIDTHIKDVGKHRQLDLKANVGDLQARAIGTLKTRSLIGSDLRFEATAADAARLASVFKVSGVPAAPLTVTGRTISSRKEMKFEALTVTLVDASVRASGSMQARGERKIAMNFKVAAASLKKLRDTLPEIAVAASGDFTSAKDRIELKNLQGTLGKTQLAGSLLLAGKHIEAQLSSPRVDLTPFFPQEEKTETADGKKAPPPPPPPKGSKESQEPKEQFVFSEKPLDLKKMKETDAKVHLAFGELILGDRSIKNLDTNLLAKDGKLTFDLRAAGAHEGTMQGAGTLVPAGDGTVDLDMTFDISNVRASLGSAEIPAADVPPLGMAMNIKIHGSSLRQLASGANGQLLFTQGAGRTKSGFISAYGSGVVSQLGAKLNPFAKEDPFMRLDCTIARADIVNGQVTVQPVLVQTEKVTITAQGTIDLHTEKLLLDFNTRPRKGIGVSPGMFTNPLIRLEGTLASPKIGVGAKGVASGALAAATGGATVVAGGFIDRMQGEQDLCAPTLEAARNPIAKENLKGGKS